MDKSGTGNKLYVSTIDSMPVLNISRRLNFDEESPERSPFPKTPKIQRVQKHDDSLSPPYKKVRALRLFDERATPNTILRNSCTTPAPRRTLPRRSQNGETSGSTLSVNINPYSPTCSLFPKKRTRDVSSPIELPPPANNKDMEELEIRSQPKRCALEKNVTSRYFREFMELEVIGHGEFGTVAKCINRLDGVFYAIKRSNHPSTGTYWEKTALNEVYAHAVIGSHPNVVRYYSAWAEDDHMFIQNEYCNNGSLADKLKNGYLNYNELRRLIVQVAEGLRYMHSLGLVHMDIKPDNIFVHKVAPMTLASNVDDGFEDIDEPDEQETVTYKLGDLGHVTSMSDPQVEEGDCRYLSREILNDDYSNLCKADIFAFGITLLEAAGMKPVPKNGEKWQSIRNGVIPPLPQKLPRQLMELIKRMIDNDPCERPTAIEILRMSLPSSLKSKVELCKDLQVAHLEIRYLRQLKGNPPSHLRDSKKINRSSSTTTF